MGSRSRIVLLCGVLAAATFAAYQLNSKIQRAGIHWLDVGDAVYRRFRPSDCSADDVASAPLNKVDSISMKDASELLGANRAVKSFALSVVDLNSDGKDDVLIGAHENNPLLFMNAGERFTDESRALFADDRILDRHGYSFADLDNDGDLDLAIASGGEDGVGTGDPNLFLRNDSDEGALQFTEMQVSTEMAEPAARSRSLMPIASADGKAVDLYLAALFRDGFPNRLFNNLGSQKPFQFQPAQNFLTLSINDHGRGVIADFDGDGNNDYLVVEEWRLKIYWHSDSRRRPSILSYRAASTTVGDFNNDGYLDIFLGTFSGPSRSDNLAANDDELIYVIHKNRVDDSSSIRFKSQSSVLEFNLDQYIPATVDRPLAGGQDIYLGSRKLHPESRIFSLDRQQALEQPTDFSQPGIYIWYSTSTQEWNMQWVFYDNLEEFKGVVRGDAISGVVGTNFTRNNPDPVTDAIFINQGDGNFSELCTGLSAHRETTSDSTVADFNNDGWLDIIGLRQGEQGSPSGDLVVLTNHAGSLFTETRIGLRDEDKLKNADLIAHGFFDGDDKPDIFLTNGYGQVPGNDGSLRLMLNNSSTQHPALMVNLRGTSANRFGTGARLTLTDANDSLIGFRLQGLNSNITQDTHWMHFGLGQFPAPYHLKVDWPDGITTRHAFSAPGRYEVVQ
jgi:hypothetical protein